MARPLPVNLLMAGTGAVLLVSGLGGETIGEVLRGQFGDLSSKKKTVADSESVGAGSLQNVSDITGGEGGGGPLGGSSPSSSTFAPSPTVLGIGRHSPSKAEQARAIASILLSRGIRNPTERQIVEAREQYQHETGIKQFRYSGEEAREFVGGLPVI
jgi:hypothetical protein